MPVIDAEGLTKRWGDFTAVDDLHLTVDEGECYAFLGRNGAGKSTTARMFLDFLRPTSGRVRVLGGVGRDPAVRARIGYLPGDLDLPATMTGDEAVHYFGGIGHQPDRTRVDELAERLGMTRDRPFHQMSTGSRRKVGLVLAFMNDPDLLILDEPTSGLDPVLQDTFREMVLERKAEGATVWLTSHVMSDVDRVADRVGLIDQGKLAQQLTMDELRHQSSGNIELTFANQPDASSFDGVAGVSNVQVTGHSLAFHVDGPVAAALARAAELNAVSIKTTEHDLEDIFLSTYADEEGR